MHKPKPWRLYTQKCFPWRLLVAHRSPQKFNGGWTLIEIAAITVITGILAAMVFPSIGGMQGRGELRSTMNTVKSAFQEAQRNAMKKGSACTLVINPTAKTITASQTGCLSNPISPSSVSALDDMTFTSPTATTNVLFSFKGNVDLTADLTIVLTSTKTADVRCLVIAPPLGLLRSGTYASNTCTSDL